MVKYSLCSTYFRNLPEGWVNNGFIINNGLQSPEYGGTNITAYWDIYSTLDAHILRARINIANKKSSFALFKKYHLQGGIGIIDCEKKQLSLYKPWLGGEIPEMLTSAPITIEIVENRDYIISYEKENGSYHRLKILDAVTGQSNEVAYLNSSHPFGDYAGKQWGAPGIMFLRGNILVKKFEFISEAPEDSEIAIFGDSITEGHGMDNRRATYHERCSAKVREAVNGRCVISGRGSGDSADLLARMNFDLEKFNPKYVVIIIGTNDTDMAVWKENIEKIILKIRGKGAQPIICVPPVGGVLIPQIAEYLQDKDYSVVRMDYATSVNHDGVTQDTTLFLDTFHPNTFGNQRMYSQLLIDAPEIFE